MVDVDKAVIARYKDGDVFFEILVNSELALEFKSGKEIPINDILAVEKVFFDAKKGLAASENRLKTLFETDDIYEIAKEIIKKGEIQLTTEYKAKLLEEKRNKIITAIQINGIDPRTNLPHPRNRIELALDEAKIKINDHKSVDKQVEEIVKKLRPILPIKVSKSKLEVIVPAEYAGKAYAGITSSGKVLKDNWNNDGSLSVTIEVPAGIRNDVIDKINSLTKGNNDVKIIDE